MISPYQTNYNRLIRSLTSVYLLDKYPDAIIYARIFYDHREEGSEVSLIPNQDKPEDYVHNLVQEHPILDWDIHTYMNKIGFISNIKEDPEVVKYLMPLLIFEIGSYVRYFKKQLENNESLRLPFNAETLIKASLNNDLTLPHMKKYYFLLDSQPREIFLFKKFNDKTGTISGTYNVEEDV